jgi:ketosteroid isomerase-like protein
MDDQAAVKEANARFYEALSSQNLEAMDALWAHESWTRCVHPGWDILKGWPSIRQSWSSIFKNTEYLKIHISNLAIQTGNDIAWVTCTENIASAHEANYQTATALATNIFHKINGLWLLGHHHASPVAVGAPLEASESIQ